MGSCRFAAKLLWPTAYTSPPARVCAVKPAHGNDAAIFACFLFCTVPFPRKGTAQERYKIYYHYQEEFSINFHIYIHKKSTRVRFLSADASFCKRQAKKQSLVLVKKVAGEALQNRKIPRQHSFKGTTILLQLHVSIQQSGGQLLYRSPLFVLILSAVYPFAAGWISDIPAASGSPQSLPSWKAPASLPVPAPG